MTDLTVLLHCGSVRRLEHRAMDDRDIAADNPDWRRNVRAWALEHVMKYAHDCDDVEMIANVAPALLPSMPTTWTDALHSLYDLAENVTNAERRRDVEYAENEYRDYLLTVVA